jgi:hypothetical protein
LKEDVLDVEDPAEKLLAGFVDEGGVVEGEPVLEIGVGHLDVEAVAFLSDEDRGLEPGLKAVLIDLFLQLRKDLEPRIQRVLHGRPLIYFSTDISTTVENVFPNYGSERLGDNSTRPGGFQAFFSVFAGVSNPFQKDALL